jgi:hypothetical protein
VPAAAGLEAAGLRATGTVLVIAGCGAASVVDISRWSTATGTMTAATRTDETAMTFVSCRVGQRAENPARPALLCFPARRPLPGGPWVRPAAVLR